jgi:hypothetical protein
MSYEQRRISWPALGAAVAMALAVTLGLAQAMDARNAPDSYLSTLAAATQSPRTEVAIEPQRIDVIAVREHRQVHGFSFAGYRRAG